MPHRTDTLDDNPEAQVTRRRRGLRVGRPLRRLVR